MNSRVKILVLANGVITIREYKPTDRSACIRVFKSNEPLYFAPSELKLLENWLDAKDNEQLAYNNNLDENFYVVEHNSNVVACGGFYITDEKRANMTWGMIERSFHKKGIGKHFLKYRVDEIKYNYPGYIISLDTSQHTFSFFEKQGFSVTKISKDAYGKGLDRYDMIMQ
ncbi:MAG: GNAT family N-acetyltransferase [Bacteroidetes bacterium]|nr:GNAT family N-acetyltransferase [Bacteroidota bacterium]